MTASSERLSEATPLVMDEISPHRGADASPKPAEIAPQSMTSEKAGHLHALHAGASDFELVATGETDPRE